MGHHRLLRASDSKAPSTMDTLSPTQRSERMARVRSKNTKPELMVRKAAHAMGYRYRLHDPRVAGRPDLVFAGRRKVIFVHGCFWHQHAGCRLARLPKSRLAYWAPKLASNKTRDELHLSALGAAGWGALVIWECELGADLRQRLSAFLGTPRPGKAQK